MVFCEILQRELEGNVSKKKKKLSWIIQRTNSAGSSLLELFALSADNTVRCTVFQFLLWDSAMNEQHSLG